MSLFPLKPTHKPVKAYYAALQQFYQHGHTTEGNTRSAFADLLKKCASPYGWHLVESLPFRGTGKQRLVADGAIEDSLGVVQGLWEAKDDDDDLDKEIKSKVADGYPLTNILFQAPSRAVLYQNNRIEFDGPITEPEKLLDVLKLFLDYTHPDIPDWKDAVEQFSGKIAELAGKATEILLSEQARNRDYREKFETFAELCRQSINPDLADDAIRKMLVQHLLTERIFRKIFNNQEFLSRNVIAVEIEKVIRSITDRHFSRDTFLKSLDRYYKAIEKAAEANENYSEKQTFLNNVYEKFFQRFDAKQADTHGIVYTPQPIVDFMVRSVEEILQQEFGKSLSDSGVHILDPFTGTGNFITRIMQQIKRSALPHKYAEELHCNEIMLLPYYIASMNIEHAYLERVGEYKSFEGICLADTFELAEPEQSSLAFMSEENTARVKKQKKSPIFVIVANPPYNVGQSHENDNNKNRVYPELSRRVNQTYARASTATNKNALSDPYVKAIRWASDRIQNCGIVAYVTNNSYVDQVAFDGMRKQLAQDFSKLYVIDLGGNVRKNPKISGTTHNVFGIQVGVSISLLVRLPDGPRGQVFFARMPEDWKRGQKYHQLDEWKNRQGLQWQEVKADTRGTWLTERGESNFDDLIPLGVKPRGRARGAVYAVFEVFSNGNDSGRDSWVYNFTSEVLLENAKKFAETYNSEVARYHRAGRPNDIDGFVIADEHEIKWTRNAKRDLRRGKYADFTAENARIALYHPFSPQWHYPGKIYNKEIAHFPRIFPILRLIGQVITVSLETQKIISGLPSLNLKE